MIQGSKTNFFQIPKLRVAYLHHFDADPDLNPSYHLNPDTAFYYNVDPDSHQGDRNLRPLDYRPGLECSILSLQASTELSQPSTAMF
jgi:hypothetical protein